MELPSESMIMNVSAVIIGILMIAIYLYLAWLSRGLDKRDKKEDDGI